MNNKEPWKINIEERIKILQDDSKKRVVYLYEKADTSTFRYRVYNIYQAMKLADTMNWQVSFFFNDELNVLKNYIDKIDICIICRIRWNIHIDEFIHKLKHNNIRIGYDVDDLIYNPDFLPIVVNTLNVDIDHEDAYNLWFGLMSRKWAVAKKANFVTSTNDYLLKQLKSDFSVPGYIIPNTLNLEQNEISEIENINRTKNEKFIIGYFSGTPTHVNDFRVAAPELKQLLDTYDDIYLKIVGFMEMPSYLAEYEKSGRIIRKPLTDFINLQSEIAEVDINIIPLLDSHFTNCKSELKYFEAGIVKVPSFASPTFVYKNIIKEGKNGFICDGGEWYSKIESFYKNRNYSIGNEAYKLAKEKYLNVNLSHYINDTFNKIHKENK